jgi:hypothetical protein
LHVPEIWIGYILVSAVTPFASVIVPSCDTSRAGVGTKRRVVGVVTWWLIVVVDIAPVHVFIEWLPVVAGHVLAVRVLVFVRERAMTMRNNINVLQKAAMETAGKRFPSRTNSPLSALWN